MRIFLIGALLTVGLSSSLRAQNRFIINFPQVSLIQQSVNALPGGALVRSIEIGGAYLKPIWKDNYYWSFGLNLRSFEQFLNADRYDYMSDLESGVVYRNGNDCGLGVLAQAGISVHSYHRPDDDLVNPTERFSTGLTTGLYAGAGFIYQDRYFILLKYQYCLPFDLRSTQEDYFSQEKIFGKERISFRQFSLSLGLLF